MISNEFNIYQFRMSITGDRAPRLQQFINSRITTGAPSRIDILRHVVKTRHHVKTVYPPNWRFV